nr:hypothetical protein [Staphylococcus epidermidis]
PELAQKDHGQMFVFDDLVKLDDRSVQLVLRRGGVETLIVALRSGSMEVRDKILANMSMRAAESLRETWTAVAPCRLSEVEAQQEEILKVVRRLVERRSGDHQQRCGGQLCLTASHCARAFTVHPSGRD